MQELKYMLGSVANIFNKFLSPFKYWAVPKLLNTVNGGMVPCIKKDECFLGFSLHMFILLLASPYASSF